MYFYEIVCSCDKELIIQKFLKMCDDSPDIQRTEKCVRQALEAVCNIEPRLSENNTIFIKKTKDVDGNYFDDVYAFCNTDSEKYSLMINPWADTVGYLVDDSSIALYGREEFSALVLWEMTWFGYDENTIRDKVESWDKCPE